MGGGLGHGVRALALARALKGQDPEAEVRVWAPARLGPFAAWAGVDLESPPHELPPDRGLLGSWVVKKVEGFRPDLLVVDLFPRGVLGEIPSGGPPRILTVRQVRDRYYRAPGPAQALSTDYQGFLACEPPPPTLDGDPRLRRVPPITLPGADDLLSREDARKALGGGGEPLVLVVGLGPVEVRTRVMAALRGFPGRVQPVGRGLPDGLDLVPAGAWLRGADAVVCNAGYATYHEVARSGVPAVFLPRERPLDDQALRAAGALGTRPSGPWRVAGEPEEVPRLLEELLRETPGPVQTWDGAGKGARLLRAW